MAYSPDEITLTQAAHLLGLGYLSTRNLALRGVLQARQVAGRFWVVDRDSALRFQAASRNAESGRPPTA
jgi:hypothetical protein